MEPLSRKKRSLIITKCCLDVANLCYSISPPLSICAFQSPCRWKILEDIKILQFFMNCLWLSQFFSAFIHWHTACEKCSVLQLRLNNICLAFGTKAAWQTKHLCHPCSKPSHLSKWVFCQWWQDMPVKTIVHGASVYVASLADNKEWENLTGVGLQK